MINSKKLISKEDSIFLAGHRGMAGQIYIKSIKK